MKNIKMILGSLLISACVMSAHAGEKTVTIGSDGILETKTVLTLNPGTTFQVNEGKTIHNYGTIDCQNGEAVQFSGTGKIINYNHIMEVSTFTDYEVAGTTKYYTPTAVAEITNTYNKNDVTIEEKMSDLNVFFRDNSDDNVATTTLVLTHQCESEAPMKLTRTDASETILVNLANEVNEGDEVKNSHSLEICGDGSTKILGNQSKFTAGEVTFNGGQSVLNNGQNGIFPVPMLIKNSGGLSICADKDSQALNLDHDINVDGGDSYLKLTGNAENEEASSTFNINADLTFSNGAKFVTDEKAPFVLKTGHTMTFSPN